MEPRTEGRFLVRYCVNALTVFAGQIRVDSPECRRLTLIKKTELNQSFGSLCIGRVLPLVTIVYSSFHLNVPTGCEGRSRGPLLVEEADPVAMAFPGGGGSATEAPDRPQPANGRAGGGGLEEEFASKKMCVSAHTCAHVRTQDSFHSVELNPAACRDAAVELFMAARVQAGL